MRRGRGRWWGNSTTHRDPGGQPWSLALNSVDSDQLSEWAWDQGEHIKESGDNENNSCCNYERRCVFRKGKAAYTVKKSMEPETRLPTY